MRAARIVKVLFPAAAGAAGAFLFDPDRGRARRARLRDQTRSAVRRDLRAVERQASRQRGRLTGVAHRMSNRSEAPPATGRVLVDKVRSEVLGRHPAIAHQINIDAVDGMVTLRGEADDPAAVDELMDAVRKVPGVCGVESFVHRPGEPAPNKAPARKVRI